MCAWRHVFLYRILHTHIWCKCTQMLSHVPLFRKYFDPLTTDVYRSNRHVPKNHLSRRTVCGHKCTHKWIQMFPCLSQPGWVLLGAVRFGTSLPRTYGWVPREHSSPDFVLRIQGRCLLFYCDPSDQSGSVLLRSSPCSDMAFLCRGSYAKSQVLSN